MRFVSLSRWWWNYLSGSWKRRRVGLTVEVTIVEGTVEISRMLCVPGFDRIDVRDADERQQFAISFEKVQDRNDKTLPVTIYLNSADKEACMDATIEGIAGRKWSFVREGDKLLLMEGRTQLATLTIAGAAVLHLLVTAPQLWDAANEVVKALPQEDENIHRLGQMVAKAVNADDWTKVMQ